MSDQEKQIEQLEMQFVAASGKAFAEARCAALASGLSVVEAQEGKLYEVFPDGTRRFLKDVAPPVTMKRGQKVAIK